RRVRRRLAGPRNGGQGALACRRADGLPGRRLVRRSTEAERQQLADTFVSLCRIDSPSRRERPCADWVAAELDGMGIGSEEDGVAAEVAGDTGNLLARIPGSGGDSILLCAHLDTVSARAPIEPVLVDGGWANTNEAILGADNKAAVAVMLELARRVTRLPRRPEVG